MKQTLQLRLGQHLTMTPQLQQAIRLLQLSTLDLSHEVQDALESNLMLENEDEGMARDRHESTETALDGQQNPEPPRTTASDEHNGAEREVAAEISTLPDELPVDSEWTDVYDSYLPASSGPATDESHSDFLAQKTSSKTLHEHLVWQLNLTPFGATDTAIATAIVDAVNEDGYFTGNLDEIRYMLSDEVVSLEEVEAVLHRIQAFDPPGVAARDPRECLLIQLRQLPEDTPYRERAIQVCADHFNLLASQDQNQLERVLQLSDAGLKSVNELIRSMNPHPGALVAESEPQYVIPDVFVTRKNGVWRVELNLDATPKLRVNPDYAKLIRRADQSDDNTCLKNHLQEARWFIKSLTSRNETVLRVASKIVEFQRGFFEHGAEAMKPLVLRDIAEVLDMHESTVSRVTTQKYMHTPRGTFEFKYFFSSHVGTAGGGECSATAIRALVKKLVAAEKPTKPLSDSRISDILGDQGINVARRTVAKYRESMGIPPSNERKRLL